MWGVYTSYNIHMELGPQLLGSIFSFNHLGPGDGTLEAW